MKPTSHSSQSKILHLIKTRGELGAGEVAESLNMTSMGARQHMEQMEQQGLLCHQFNSSGKGRPKKKWHLTQKAQAQFPDGHSALLVNLIGQMQNQLGEEAFNNLIISREQEMLHSYQSQLADLKGLLPKLTKLAEIRSNEGYMAEIIEQGEQLLFVENHCPICEAAKQCQQFCRSELEIFQALIHPDIQRTDYILSGARRCAYLVPRS